MLELEENKHKLLNLKSKINSIEEALNINNIETELKELEIKTGEPNFWDNQQSSGLSLDYDRRDEERQNMKI